jgi:LysR family transcriptional regulator, pca operon transcriptional activator
MLNARIKLRHLQAFLEVARQRSFARAAERLAITQPGMSKTIRELEETLGTSLFERTPKGRGADPGGLDPAAPRRARRCAPWRRAWGR